MSYLPKTDRRTTLKWLLAGIGTTPVLAACGAPDHTDQPRALLGVPKPISGVPYGADPDLMTPAITWDLTLSPEQLQLVAALTDILLPANQEVPAGSALGIPDFIDEWVSSPYEQTQDDRVELFALFDWLEGEARTAGASSFASANAALKTEILDRVAWKDRLTDETRDLGEAFDTFRNLSVSAYFASEAGSAWLGYLGNRPSMGDYAGPTQEALDHLDAQLALLGLQRPMDL
ncbi:MAG: gluconate 2-dehydrogenase subunit 3 family protein [Henriciella sp.]|nr:gluconate 2-dehydrogenase subunit 3 family protein [Hyphomonadaceae bacterium]